MSRLPTVSGDGNAWGTILNDFLSVSHSSNGTLKNLPINLKDTCAIDGVTDDSVPFAAAYAAAAAAGVGLYMPGGTLVKGNDTLLSNVPIDLGGGTIKLKNGANADLFSVNVGNINLAGANGTGSATGVQGWSLRNGTLDGNKANQTSGTSYPLRFYGCGYTLDNLIITNGYTGGILCDWNAGLPASHHLSALWKNVLITDCNGMGIEYGGPSDSQWINVISQETGSHNIHITPNAGGIQATNCHCWGSGAGTVAWLIEAAGTFINCEAENSDTVQLVLLSNRVQWIGGRVFAGFGGAAGAGIQIGQTAGGTPIAGEIAQSAGAKTAVAPQDYLIHTLLTDISSSNGSIWFVNDGGGSIQAQVNQTAGKYFTGTPHSRTIFDLMGDGLTSDGTAGMSSIFTRSSQAYRGFVVADPAMGDVFSIDTVDHTFLIVNNSQVKMYSDNYSTITLQLINGTICLYPSASAAATATSGTITTAGVGIARVAPTGAITGVILQAGTLSGQHCEVINESAFTITFAASGTSHVADGVSCVIAANRKMNFTWDSATSLWYHS